MIAIAWLCGVAEGFVHLSASCWLVSASWVLLLFCKSCPEAVAWVRRLSGNLRPQTKGMFTATSSRTKRVPAAATWHVSRSVAGPRHSRRRNMLSGSSEPDTDGIRTSERLQRSRLPSTGTRDTQVPGQVPEQQSVSTLEPRAHLEYSELNQGLARTSKWCTY